MKPDPMKKIRAQAAAKSKIFTGKKVFIDKFYDGTCHLAGKQSEFSVAVYKNGNEIAL